MEAARPPLETAAAGGRRLGMLPVLLTVVGLLLIAAVGYVLYERYLARPLVQPVAGTPVQVRRASLQSTVAATGSVVSTRQSRLTMQVSGRLKELPVKLGDEVKAGAVLARIDTAPLELRLAQSKSSLRTAQVKLDQLKAGARPEEVAQAEASVQSAQGKLNDLQAGTLPQEIAAAQAQADNASAQIRQAQARLDGLRSGANAADLSAAEQALKAAEANADRTASELAKVKTPSEEELAPLRIQVEKTAAMVRQARGNYDKVAWRPDIGLRPESIALAQATADYESAQAQLRIKQQPRQTDVEAAQRAVESAQAQVIAAQARIDQLKAGPSAEEVRQAQAAIEAAQATYQQASARVAALQSGAKPGELQAAQAAVAQAQQQLALRRAPTTTNDVALAEEQVNLAQLLVQQTQLDIDNATLTAPFDGVIGALAVNVGEQVSAQTAIMTLVDPKATRVDVAVDEADLARIAPGKVAQVSFDSMPGRQFAGKVIGIAPTASVTQGLTTYTVSVGVDDPDFYKAAPPGLTANVGIVVAAKENALVIPSRAIKRAGRNPSVDVAVGERAEARPIKTGLADGQLTEIVEGLTESDTVLIPAMSTVAPRGAQPPPNPLAPVAPRPAGKL
jgi:HlyD family secretion protein